MAGVFVHPELVIKPGLGQLLLLVEAAGVNMAAIVGDGVHLWRRARLRPATGTAVYILVAIVIAPPFIQAGVNPWVVPPRCYRNAYWRRSFAESPLAQAVPFCIDNQNKNDRYRTCTEQSNETKRLSVPKTPSIGFANAGESEHDCWMFAIAFLFVRLLCDCFKSRRRLEAEILVLRHQLNVLQQRAPRRLCLTWVDRALFVWLYRGFPRILNAITILRPETIVRWHRKGFGAFWRWKSRPLGGRPQIDKEVRDLIRRMSFENPLWGAPHIHGELLKLGFDVAQSTVSKYMVPRRGRPSQTWKTFLHNHADGIAAIDLFVVPTIAFEQLFAFLVLGHGRRQLLWFAVTRHPTAEWLARQITEAFPWEKAPLRNSLDLLQWMRSMFRSARMHRTGARSSASAISSHMQSWADCITGTHVSSFWKRQGGCCHLRRGG